MIKSILRSRGSGWWLKVGYEGHNRALESGGRRGKGELLNMEKGCQIKTFLTAWIKENQFLSLISGIVFLCLILSWILYGLFGHQLIEAIYNGESVGFLNRIIISQAMRPLEYYLNSADEVFYQMVFSNIVFCGILLTIIGLWDHLDKGRLWVGICLCLVMVLSLIHQSAFNTDADDPYIAYRYALNLASGDGLVFNIGDRVEGYSDFLWVLILSASYYLFGLDIPLTARVLGTGITLVAILLTYQLSMEITGKDRHGSLIAALLVAASGSVACYGPSGLETPLFTLLIILSFLCAVQRKWILSSLLAGLSVMTRPDGIFLLFLLIAWKLVICRSLKERVLGSLKILVPFSCIVLPWTIWRWTYYGHLIPNSVEAKKGLDIGWQILSGLKYVWQFILQNAPFMTVLGIATLAFIVNRSKKRGRSIQQSVGFLAFFIVIFVLYVILVGGDWMPAWRFLAPIVPLLAVLIVSLWCANIRESSFKPSGLHCIVIFVLVFLLSFISELFNRNMMLGVRVWRYQVEGLSEIGRWLNRTLPSDTLIAVHANGALSYYSRLPTIDMLGPTDEHIARSGQKKMRGSPGHVSNDYEYVARREPSIIAWLRGQGFEQVVNDGYFRDEFRSKYVPVSFRFKKTTNPLGEYVNLLLLKSKKEYLVQLLTRPAHEVEVVKITRKYGAD